MDLFIGCICISSGGQDFYVWVTDKLSHHPFTDAEACYAEVKAKMDREWKEAERRADSAPHWIDTEEDEFTYTDGFGTHTVSYRIYKLEQ